MGTFRDGNTGLREGETIGRNENEIKSTVTAAVLLLSFAKS